MVRFLLGTGSANIGEIGPLVDDYTRVYVITLGHASNAASCISYIYFF